MATKKKDKDVDDEVTEAVPTFEVKGEKIVTDELGLRYVVFNGVESLPLDTQTKVQ